MKLPGRQTTGRSSRRLMDVVMEDMKRVDVTERDAGDRQRWRQMITAERRRLCHVTSIPLGPVCP